MGDQGWASSGVRCICSVRKLSSFKLTSWFAEAACSTTNKDVARIGKRPSRVRQPAQVLLCVELCSWMCQCVSVMWLGHTDHRE